METRLLIGGEQAGGSGAELAVENPAAEETPRGPCRGTGAGGRGHRRSIRGTPAWGSIPAVERAELLHEVATRLRARTDEIARVMTLEGGKPLLEDRDEVGWTAAAFDYYAEMGRDFAGRVIPSIDPPSSRSWSRSRSAVWGCIVPWTYPLLLLAWKVAPARPPGTRWWPSPSELTPLSTLMLAPCFEHLPPVAFNVVAGAGDVGEGIVRDARVASVAFTGRWQPASGGRRVRRAMAG